MDWITGSVAIGDCVEPKPEGMVVLDLRDIPDHCRISPEVIDRAVGFIDWNVLEGDQVFVHCICGVSRSSAIVAAYLSLHHGMTVDAALGVIRKCRPIVQPHVDQILSVKEWRNSR